VTTRDASVAKCNQPCCLELGQRLCHFERRKSERRLDTPKRRMVAEDSTRLQNEASGRNQTIDFSVERYV
jgi:hypothetical protein